MCKQQQQQKNTFPVSVVGKAMLIATDTTFSKLVLFLLREQGPTHDASVALVLGTLLQLEHSISSSQLQLSSELSLHTSKDDSDNFLFS